MREQARLWGYRMSILSEFSHSTTAIYIPLGSYGDKCRELFLKEPTIAEMAQAEARAYNSKGDTKWEQSIWLSIICVYAIGTPEKRDDGGKVISPPTYVRAFGDADYNNIISRVATDEINGLLQAVADETIVLVNKAFQKNLPKATGDVGGKTAKKHSPESKP